MSVPVIDPESSVLSYPQWQAWEHQFSATNNPTSWQIVAGGFPTGMNFEPSWNVTGASSGYTINQPSASLFANGTILVFSAINGGAGFATGTRYYVVNAGSGTFQLSATSGGAPVVFTTDIIATSVLFRPGYLAGAATLPGISTVQLTATNADPATSAAVLFTIGIEGAAVAPDSNADLVWDFATNAIIAQTSSALVLTPVGKDAAGLPIPQIFVKEQDDLIIRLRLVKATSIIDLTVADDAARLVLKEAEPEKQVVISDHSKKFGTGDSSNILLHAKIDGAALKSSLSDYEEDTGTFYTALAEIELTFTNPFGVGPDTLVRTSRTFGIQIERDLGES